MARVFPEKSCGSVILRRDGAKLCALLVRGKKRDKWSFPKGHMEDEETERETALREVYEETGLRIEPVEGFRRSIHYLTGAGNDKEVVFFLSFTDSQRVVPQLEEITGFAWLPVEEALERVTFECDRDVLADAIAFAS